MTGKLSAGVALACGCLGTSFGAAGGERDRRPSWPLNQVPGEHTRSA
jgi:hypothetical protein